MRRLVLSAILAAGACMIRSLPEAAAQSSCQSIVKAVAEARASGYLDRLAGLYASAVDARSGCSGQATFCIGRSVALGHLGNVYVRAKAGAKADEIVATLRRGRTFGSPWQLLVAQGDVEMGRGHAGDQVSYAAAAEAYELAINDLKDGSPCQAYGEPSPPTRDQIAVFYKRMVQAKLLAPKFDLTRTRDNECGGVFVQHVRDFAPAQTTLPIEFEYNSTKFTPKGREAASALRECAVKYSRIRLSGHTDRVGSDEFNLDLSRRRLEAVRKLLVDGGFRGIVELDPKGKREPFMVDDPTQYTDEQIDQMNRRVELRGATE